MEQITVTMVSLLTTSTSGYGANTSANYLNSLLMYGSANAAWVPCPLEGWHDVARGWVNASGHFQNTGAADPWVHYTIPLPTTKGGLKLYISGTRVGLEDAAATDKVDITYVVGRTSTGISYIDTDNTDKDTQGEHEDTFTALDCSTYTAVKVTLVADVTNAGGLDINYVAVRCYYA